MNLRVAHAARRDRVAAIRPGSGGWRTRSGAYDDEVTVARYGRDGADVVALRKLRWSW